MKALRGIVSEIISLLGARTGNRVKVSRYLGGSQSVNVYSESKTADQQQLCVFVVGLLPSIAAMSPDRCVPIFPE